MSKEQIHHNVATEDVYLNYKTSPDIRARHILDMFVEHQKSHRAMMKGYLNGVRNDGVMILMDNLHERLNDLKAIVGTKQSGQLDKLNKVKELVDDVKNAAMRLLQNNHKSAAELAKTFRSMVDELSKIEDCLNEIGQQHAQANTPNEVSPQTDPNTDTVDGFSVAGSNPPSDFEPSSNSSIDKSQGGNQDDYSMGHTSTLGNKGANPHLKPTAPVEEKHHNNDGAQPSQSSPTETRDQIEHPKQDSNLHSPPGTSNSESNLRGSSPTDRCRSPTVNLFLNTKSPATNANRKRKDPGPRKTAKKENNAKRIKKQPATEKKASTRIDKVEDTGDFFLRSYLEEVIKNRKDLSMENRTRLKEVFLKDLEEINETDFSPTRTDGTDEDYAQIDKILEPIMKSKLPHDKNNQIKKKLETKIPITLFTTELNPNLNVLVGENVAEEANKFSKTMENTVYESKKFSFTKRIKKIIESRFFKYKGFSETYGKERGEVLPIDIIDCATDCLDNLEERVTKTTACILRNVSKKLGVNLDDFEPNALKEILDNQTVKVQIQRPQHHTRNVKLGFLRKKTDLNDQEDRERQMKGTIDMGTDAAFEEKFNIIVDNHLKRKALVDAAVDDFLKNPSQSKNIMDKLRDGMRESQFEPSVKLDPSIITCSFATNVDLPNLKACPKQAKIINKLWDFLRPRKRLMAHVTDIIPGMNGVQLYVKEPGARTSLHQENQVVASVNWNVGPGECIWLIVPLAYAAKMEELLSKKNKWPYNGRHWPSEEDLKKHGISYQKVIQKPDDLIYIGVGSFHWVQANSYCVNVSWNVAEVTTTQLAATALYCDHYMEQKYDIILPVESMLWDIAKKNVKPESEFSALTKSLLVRSLARCQMEWDYVTEKHGKDLKPLSQENSLKILRCRASNCYRKNLFNIVIVEEERSDGSGVRCCECAKDIADSKCYYRHTMQDLIAMFNNYK